MNRGNPNFNTSNTEISVIAVSQPEAAAMLNVSTDFVRAELALQAEPLIAARAKERMLAGVKADPTANLPEGGSQTRDELATMSGVSARNISKVKNILESGSEELVDQVHEKNTQCRGYRSVR